MNENDIIAYVEPIFRFCCRRVNDRYDAEDLSSEIICHVLDGMRKYPIVSLDAWIWRVAHNRYAKFVDSKNKYPTILIGDAALLDAAASAYAAVDEEDALPEYQTVFRYLHTLSAAYRDIFVDYYIGEMSVRQLAAKYALSEATIKWRLNVGRQKVKKRIGENHMDQIYKRIHWNTTCCNGSMNADSYLHTQISRAICQAAYEKPLTVEELSISTGIPAMYIEDELSRLEYGDAVCKSGNTYATNFIVLRLQDKRSIEGVSASLVNSIADQLEELLKMKEDRVNNLDFYGHDFGMSRLGHFLIPYMLRRQIRTIKNERLHLTNGPFPPRKDGGYGWFIVEETMDENERCAEYSTGCNIAGDDAGSKSSPLSHIYYYWISKYFDNSIYHNTGTRWLCAHDIPKSSNNGVVKKDRLSDEEAARLMQNSLIKKSGHDYQLNFACFTEKQFGEFAALWDMGDKALETLLARWIHSVHRSFEQFVPKRLADQINQWVSGYVYQIIGYVTDELIQRNVLKKPELEKPFTDGVFCVEGSYIDP